MPAPTPLRLFFSGLLVTALLFLRSPTTNFIFDEQEALLGNPYLNGNSSFFDAFFLDFWGREPARTIGAYRPLPNLLWWPFSASLALRTPWVFCWLNLLIHVGTVTLFASSVQAIVSRALLSSPLARLTVWGSAAFLAVCATSTEALCSAVGLADLLVGLWLATSLWLCAVVLPGAAAGRGTAGLIGGGSFCLVALGLLSKETMLAGVVLLPLLVWAFAPGPIRGGRKIAWAGSSMVGGLLALVSFVLMRGAFFSAKPAEMAALLPGVSSTSLLARFFDWFGQPTMPVDPYNNPLLSVSISERLATASGLFATQLGQILIPQGLSGDYSYPRELPVTWGPRPALGLILAGGLLLLGLGSLLRWSRGARSGSGLLLGLGALWIVITYLPVSNSLVLLPTIRGDRLLYPTTMGVALCVAGVLSTVSLQRIRPVLVVASLLILAQATQARLHALSFSSDLAFWRAASEGPHASAKALLNYGVMLGARGDERSRLKYTEAALRRAPEWPMGRIYLADTYCRLKDLDAAWPHYKKGFAAVPNSKALTALGVQCLWEAGGVAAHEAELRDLAASHPGSWLDFFVDEVMREGAEHGGISQKYRPRRYNAPAASSTRAL